MKKKMNYMVTLSFLAISVFFASPVQARPDVLCIYYPEWHVYPEGEEIFGKGRSEWDLVNTAKPFFPGHDQPVQLLDGCPDDSDPAAVAKEINYAADSGIDVFVYDWYWRIRPHPSRRPHHATQKRSICHHRSRQNCPRP